MLPAQSTDYSSNMKATCHTRAGQGRRRRSKLSVVGLVTLIYGDLQDPSGYTMTIFKFMFPVAIATA